jgi:DNA ligase-1
MSNQLVILKNQFDAVKKATGKSKIPVIKTFATAPGMEGTLFRETYNFIFNPHISSGIAKKKMNKELPQVNFDMDLDLIGVMDFLEEHNSGSDNVVGAVQTWIKEQPSETHEFLKNVFIQDLQIGASEKAINEALGYEYIPVWEVMLAKRWEKEEHKVKGKFFITQKMDDYRCTVIYNEEDERWQLKARSGMEYELCVEIEEIFNQLPKEYVYDGGLISDDESLDSKARFRATGKILKTIGPKKGLMFYIYDMVTQHDFKKGKSTLGYEQRQDLIEKLISNYDIDNKLFRRVPCWYAGEDKEVIFPFLEEALKMELEGLMINTANGKYETKRTDQLLKVKEFYTIDLRVVDTYEYKHPGNLGGFICEYKDGNTVRVGGGFKQHERKEFWEKREEMIGKIIEVRYFQESTNQNGGKSIRHGHFMGVRWDKNEPSFD